MELTPVTAIVLLAGGLLGGAMNAVAGAGSLINLPLLIFAGLPPSVANATNRVAIVAQSASSMAGYARGGEVPWRATGALLLPTLLGSVAGSFLATRISDQAFLPVIAVALVGMAITLLLRPSVFLHPPETPGLGGAGSAIVYFAIGAYGGFIQVGVGFFFVAALVRGTGLGLVASNGARVTLTGALSVVSLVIFLLAGDVVWPAGLLLAAGNAVGAYVGARTAVLKGAGWIRWVLLVAVVLTVMDLLGVFGALGRWLGIGG